MQPNTCVSSCKLPLYRLVVAVSFMLLCSQFAIQCVKRVYHPDSKFLRTLLDKFCTLVRMVL
jgi:hypothetical protein